MRIAIDAGHGPQTAGKRSPDGSLREFQFNHAVALYLRELLQQYGKVETLMVHAEDGSRDVPLKERTDKANQWRADIYLSIHANASGSSWSTAEGIETYIHPLSSAASLRLAQAVQRQLVKLTGRRDRGVKQANFHVLRETAMPAILVECGFMTHLEEARLLQTDGYRRQCAQALAAGVAEVYGLKAATGGGEQMINGFKDVPQEHWAAAAIGKVTEAGIMNGVTTDEFGIGQPVTREQLAVILDRLGLLQK